MKHSFCDDWEFTHHWTEAFGKGLPVPKQQAVRLPDVYKRQVFHKSGGQSDCLWINAGYTSQPIRFAITHNSLDYSSR